MTASTSQPEGAGFGILPTGRLKPLVEAAWGPVDAESAWDDYLSQLGAQKPRNGEVRLFPLVASRLPAATLKLPKYNALRSERVRTVIRNNVVVKRAAKFAKLMEEIQVPLLYGKGFALLARCFRSYGLRVVGDVDVHVPATSVQTVLDLADKMGWENTVPENGISLNTIRAGCSTNFVTQDDGEIDFHWVPRPPFAYQTDLVQHMWDTANMVEWEGGTWPILSDTWLLLETIEHGLRNKQSAPIRWLIDGLTLLKQDDCDIDWEFVSHAAKSAHIAMPIALGLRTLQGWGATVPDRVIAELDAAPKGWADRLEHRLRFMDSIHIISAIGDEFLQRYLRGPGSAFSKTIGFPLFYRNEVRQAKSWAAMLGAKSAQNNS